MADLKIRIKIDYADRYEGKQPQLFKKFLALPTFEYDKTAKVEDAELTAKDVEKEFELAARGIFATISYIVDEVLRENKITPKGGVTPSALKPTQAQLNKELAPFKKNLTKLLEGTIDELGGNEVADSYDPKDNKAVDKFLEAMAAIDAINPGFVKLDKELAALRTVAAAIIAGRSGEAPPVLQHDKPWLALIEKVEAAQAEFAAVVKEVQRPMKARPPSLPVQKAASKESKEQKETREALNALAGSLGEIPKLLDDVNAVISETTTLCTGLVAALKAGRVAFKLGKWPEVPDSFPAWKKFEAAVDAAGKQLKLVEKLTG